MIACATGMELAILMLMLSILACPAHEHAYATKGVSQLMPPL